jgi:hypothetical protein
VVPRLSGRDGQGGRLGGIVRSLPSAGVHETPAEFLAVPSVLALNNIEVVYDNVILVLRGV